MKIPHNLSKSHTNTAEHFPKFSKRTKVCQIAEDFGGRLKDVLKIDQQI